MQQALVRAGRPAAEGHAGPTRCPALRADLPQFILLVRALQPLEISCPSELAFFFAACPTLRIACALSWRWAPWPIVQAAPNLYFPVCVESCRTHRTMHKHFLTILPTISAAEGASPGLLASAAALPRPARVPVSNGGVHTNSKHQPVASSGAARAAASAPRWAQELQPAPPAVG